MKSLLSALSVLLLVFTACSPIIKVYSEPEPGVNLYQFRTYGWLPDEEMESKNSGNALLGRQTAEKIRNSVDAEMATYGFKICPDTPDLRLHYHIVLENKVYYQHEWYCNEETRIRYGHCHRLKPVYFQEGTLMLDLIDARRGNQVWRGVAVGVFENWNNADRERLIKQAVQEIFEKFPEQKLFAQHAPAAKRRN